MKTSSHQPNSKRRKIVTGSLAAPVVLTVSSPAAATMTTFGKCLANQANQPQPTFFGSEDTWLRTRVDLVQLRHGNNGAFADGFFYKDPNAGYVNVANLQGPGTGDWTEVATSEKRWALVWVDSQNGSQFGTIQIQRPSNYTATTCSCYASINPSYKKG